MNSQFGIIETSWAYLLLGLIAAYILLKRSEGVRATRTAQLRGEKQNLTPLGAQYRARLWITLLLLFVGIFAVLRPYGGYEDVELRTSGRDILAIVDVSNSMLASDVSPSRLGLVKRKLLDLVRMLKEEGRQDRLGLLVFAGRSELFAPLTADYAVLKNFVNALSPDLVVQGGSDLEGALRSAEEVFAELSSEQPLVLVFTDGSDEALSSDLLEGSYRAKKVPLVFFGVGTLEGSRIEVAPGVLVTDYQGRVVISKLNEAGLRESAERAGGLYLRSRLDEGDLLSALQLLKELRGGKELDSRIRVYRELGPLLLKIALVGLLALALTKRLSWAFPVLLLFAPLAGEAKAEETAENEPATSQQAPSLHEAWKAYGAEDFDAARQGFAEEVRRHPENLRALQALGSAEYKLGNLPSALKHFKALADAATTERERFEGLYNKGNTELGLRKYDDAIKSYESALELRPGDEKAAHNLEVAKQLKMATPPPKSQPSSSSSSASQSEDSASSAPSSEQDSSESGSSSSEESGSDASSSGSANSSQGSGTSDSNESSDTSGSAGSEQTSSSQRSGAQGSSENEDNSSSERSYSPSEQENSSHDAEALKEQEAKAWLESLPDSPMIPKREGRRQMRQGVNTW
jgi:Ca-activated chloride channel family protein